jgi:hypothetical protein
VLGDGVVLPVAGTEPGHPDRDDEQVQPAQGVGGLGDHRGAPVEVERVERRGGRTAQLPRERHERVLVAAGEREPRPLAVQGPGDRAAQHTRRPRHQRPRPGEIHLGNAKAGSGDPRGECRRPVGCTVLGTISHAE